MLKKNLKEIDLISPATPLSFEDNNLIKLFLNKYSLKYNFFHEDSVSLTKYNNNFFSTIEVEKRFCNLISSAENPNSRILWCTRGGYGSADLLPLLAKYPNHKIPKKTLVGFSDITSIATFMQKKWGWDIICAPMLYQIIKKKVSDDSIEKILNLILHKNQILEYNLALLKGKESVLLSELVGGCLSVLCSNIGTKYQINWHNKILFLEDEGEDGERLDRYLTQIAFMINENKQKPKAIILGNFLAGNEFGSPKSEKVEIAIKLFLKKILFDLPIYQEKNGILGHSFNQEPIGLGIKTKISLDNKIQQKINLNILS
ncbi:MAG: LD-carboxypeptidase [Alphaproteobacteria bacterium]